MAARDIVSNHVILNEKLYNAINNFLITLKSADSKHCYNILNNLICYHRLVSFDASYHTASSDVFKYTVDCYNELFSKEIPLNDSHQIEFNGDYAEFCMIIQKMKSLKLSFERNLTSRIRTTPTAFHQVYAEDVTRFQSDVTAVDVNQNTCKYQKKSLIRVVLILKKFFFSAPLYRIF